ncbi:MAG: MFS transporter [Proteobacteria bacterium]|nr:MFS transporter [Pseudomonadota bacterium]
MEIANKAVRIDLRDVHSPQMRAFHMAWFAFFVCFFGWFGIAPLMAVVRGDLGLTREQIGNTIIASVAATIVARPLVGWLCDRVGPTRTYSWLMILGAIPVMAIGLADSYATLLVFRLAIGVLGASFVITQYHTSVMFAPNCVGTANATSAGWGNLGGGVAQFAMPLLLGVIAYYGIDQAVGWRFAMIGPGLALIAVGVAYRLLTQDTPEGDLADLRSKRPANDRAGSGQSSWSAAKDYRVWALFLIYGACFGVELTINNVAAMYFVDEFSLSLEAAGFAAAAFGLMNLFARTLGGYFADRWGISRGLKGRLAWLGLVLFGEGIALIVFSQMEVLFLALATLVVFSLFVQMSEGATFSLVPLINKHAIGTVSGIVGAGGNAGAVAAGFLFRSESLSTATALLCMGIAVVAISSLTLVIRFSEQDESEARRELQAGLARRQAATLAVQ